MGIVPQPGIMEIALYVGGEARIAGRDEVLKLSANENPFGPPPSAVASIQAAAAEIHRYPPTDHGALHRAIAEVHGLDPDRLICGVGSDEVLQFAVQAYAGPGDEVIVPGVSWSTTYYPLHQYGLKLRFVDIDLHTLETDPARFEARLFGGPDTVVSDWATGDSYHTYGGDDFLRLGNGDDTVNAGTGRDTFQILAEFDPARITPMSSGFRVESVQGLDTLLNVEIVQFSDVSISVQVAKTIGVTLTGDANPGIPMDFLFGSEGDDILRGGTAKDWLFGDDGDDRLVGGLGGDHLSGGDGQDLLLGQQGSDVLLGGRGEDDLRGGGGKDRMFGQNGSDSLLEASAKVGLVLGGQGDQQIVWTQLIKVASDQCCIESG